MAEEQKPTFFNTVPGCITAVTGLITAVGGLIAVLYQAGVIGPKADRTVQPRAVEETAHAAGPASAITTNQSLAGQDSGELDRRQARLEEKLRQLEGQMQNRADEADPGEAPAAGLQVPQVPSLAGVWRSPTGLTYVIQQQGAYLAIQENNPLYGVTAVGSGGVQGRSLTFSISTAAGTNGTARLDLSPDDRQLQGFYQDAVTGMNVPLQMFR